jgi:hypothetical protein
MPLSFTPVPHQVFNDFDNHGITLNLPRLLEEENAAYKQRLFDVMIHRSSSTYRGLINGITRELGLQIYEAIQIDCLKNPDGTYILPAPAVTFDGNICRLISDADSNNFTIYDEIDMNDKYSVNYLLHGLLETINATGYFLAAALPGVDIWSRSETIFNQSTIGIVPNESLTQSTNRIKLANQNLISNTVALRSPNLTERVSSPLSLTKSSQYYIDFETGILYCTSSPADGSSIRYFYHKDSTVFSASPVIIHNLQQDPFRKRLFVQNQDADGEDMDGCATPQGIDIINELLSVVPYYWGT